MAPLEEEPRAMLAQLDRRECTRAPEGGHHLGFRRCCLHGCRRCHGRRNGRRQRRRRVARRNIRRRRRVRRPFRLLRNGRTSATCSARVGRAARSGGDGCDGALAAEEKAELRAEGLVLRD
jgi:hypothetical protein